MITSAGAQKLTLTLSPRLSSPADSGRSCKEDRHCVNGSCGIRLIHWAGGGGAADPAADPDVAFDLLQFVVQITTQTTLPLLPCRCLTYEG